MAGITDKNKSTKVKIRNNKMKNIVIYAVVIGLFFMGLIGVISYVSKYKKEADEIENDITEDISGGIDETKKEDESSRTGVDTTGNKIVFDAFKNK